MLIQFDDASCSDFLQLLRGIPIREDIVYLCFKSDPNGIDSYLSHYLTQFFSNVEILRADKASERQEMDVLSGVIYVCDLNFVEQYNFLVERSTFVKSIAEKTKGENLLSDLPLRSLPKGGLVAQLLELWAYGASLILTSITDPLVTNLVRMAWQSCSEVLPLSSPYFANLNSFAESSFIAGNYRMYELSELVTYLNQANFGSVHLPYQISEQKFIDQNSAVDKFQNKPNIKREKIKNQNLKAITSLRDFKVFKEVIYEEMLDKCRKDLGFNSMEETKKILEFYQPALHLLTKNFIHLLREKQPSIVSLLNVCDRVARDILTKVGQYNQPLRIWVLNAGMEELPFMIYDRFASNLTASLDRPYVPKGISLFATHPITHLRRPRVDLEKLREVDWKGLDISSVSKHLSEVRNQINSRKYSNNIVTAKHSPGLDPPYRQIDVLFTNGLGEVLDSTILKMFVGNLRKSLRPSAYVITSVQESKILAKDLLEAGLQSRASELNILGDCHAFQLY